MLPLALTVTFGLELLRVWIAELFYYLNEVANAGYATLVGVAAVVFAMTFFAGAARRRLGGRALLIIGGGVGVVRLIEQINQDTGRRSDRGLDRAGAVLDVHADHV